MVLNICVHLDDEVKSGLPGVAGNPLPLSLMTYSTMTTICWLLPLFIVNVVMEIFLTVGFARILMV